MAKIDLSSFNKQMKAVQQVGLDMPAAALKEFIKNTPINKGTARRKTKLQDTKIIADYPYSQKLEDGHSDQAPDGMIEPTTQWIEIEVTRRLKGL